MNKKSFQNFFVILCITLGIIFVIGIGAVILGNLKFGSTEISMDYDGGSYQSYEDSFETAPMESSMYERSYTGDEVVLENLNYDSEVSKLIKIANIVVEVDDIDKTLENISDLIGIYEGSIMNLNDYGKGLDRIVSLNIRIEQREFESLYKDIKELEGQFVESSINVSDVTETIIDLETRLNNYRNVEIQFLSILESAQTVEDTLAVYKEINRVRLDIERVEAQLKNMETQTDYSYIYVGIQQSSGGAQLKEDEWRPVGVLKEALRALVSFGQFLGSLFIWIIVFIPVIAVIVVPIMIIQKKRKK